VDIQLAAHAFWLGFNNIVIKYIEIQPGVNFMVDQRIADKCIIGANPGLFHKIYFFINGIKQISREE